MRLSKVKRVSNKDKFTNLEGPNQEAQSPLRKKSITRKQSMKHNQNLTYGYNGQLPLYTDIWIDMTLHMTSALIALNNLVAK